MLCFKCWVRRPIDPLLLVVISLLGAAPVVAQTRGVAESGLITWPVLSSGPIREVLENDGDAPWLLTELSTKNVFHYDPGYSTPDRLMIEDYEVTNLRASYGWQPAGRLGDGDGRVEVNLTGRLLWGGVLDPFIQTHHDLTNLPSAGQEKRPWGDTLVVIAPEVVSPEDEKISDFPDDEFVDQAVMSARGPRGSLGVGGSYSRTLRAPWVRMFLAAGGSTVPRTNSTVGAGGAVSGDITAGVHLQWQARDWLRLSGQGDLSAAAVAGAGAWRSVLTNNLLWHGAGRVDLIVGEVTLATIFSVRRAPISASYYRIGKPSISIDVAAYVPLPGRTGGQLVLGFVQDFPPSYVAPDFGVNLGVVRPVGRSADGQGQ